MSVVDPEPAAKPLVLPRLREFNEFTLEPGRRHNLFSSRLLGNVLKHFVAGAVVIDPHILHISQQIGMLEGFLRVLKIVPEIEVKIKASRVRGDERRGNFTSWSEQKKAADDLARRFATHRLTVAFPSNGYFVDHDRVIYLHLKIQDASRFYKIILGQSLFGFAAACRRRSHGVWFEVTQSEWETA